MATSSVVCPLHLDSQATFTCTRCGKFGCERCMSPQVAELCADCGERTSSPMSISVREVLRETFGFLGDRPGFLLACFGAYAGYGVVTLPIGYTLAKTEARGSGAVTSFLLLFMLLATVVNFLFSTAFEVAVTRYIGDQLTGGERSLGETLQASLEPSLSANFLLLIAVSVGGLLLIVPGIILAVALCLSIPAVVFEGRGAMDSLSDSWTRTAGQRGNLFLVLFVSGLACAGVMLLAGVLELVLTETMGKVGLMAGLVVNQAFTGVGVTIVLTAIVICYQRLSGHRA